MNRRRRRHSALLLFTFVVGGLFAPVVHRFHHAGDRGALREAVAGQPAHVHTDFAALSAALSGVSHQDLLCLFCTKLSAKANLQRAPWLVAGRVAPFVAPRVLHHSDPVRVLLSIRAPPRLA